MRNTIVVLASRANLFRIGWAVALALGFLLPVVALVGIQNIEERYLFEGDQIDLSSLDLAESFHHPGLFGLRVSPVGLSGEVVVRYRAIGFRWLMRLRNGPPIVPSSLSGIGFRSVLDPIATLPAFLLVAILSWMIAGRLAHRTLRRGTPLHT